MLIRFTVKNHLSFADETTFDMIPGRAKSLDHHIIRNDSNGINVLRAGLIYGANASGKSNLIKAIAFARDFILSGVKARQRIAINPFRLRKSSMQEPTRFEFEFIANNQAYAYGFVISATEVLEEWLYQIEHINKDKETLLFQREKHTLDGKMETQFGQPLLTDKPTSFFGYVAEATRPNQLLLNKMVDDNVEYLNPIVDWFYTLTIIFPQSKNMTVESRIRSDLEFSRSLQSFLQAMDTGISDICLIPKSWHDLDIPEQMKHDVTTKFDEYASLHGSDQTTTLAGMTTDGRRLFFRRSIDSSNPIEVLTLGTKHYGQDGEIEFEYHEESDGTQRLFDLYPMLHEQKNRVIIIDELERSLHPNLVHRFIELFLQKSEPNQLIVTTYESTLLDLGLLRRDEVWFVEKSKQGASSVYSLNEYKTRNDLDIRKGYLHGRFGAIPLLETVPALQLES